MIFKKQHAPKAEVEEFVARLLVFYRVPCVELTARNCVYRLHIQHGRGVLLPEDAFDALLDFGARHPNVSYSITVMETPL